MLNFDELNKGASQKQIDPRKLFTTLDRHSRFKRPLDEQSDVLDSWFLKRDRQDTTIKMNTGAGKTLLLALQSSIHEGIFPAVFVTPDNYLVSQVRKEAKDLGIKTTEDPNDPDFIAGRAILVINIMKLINGRSVFGVAPEGVKIKIGSIVIDDAHACLQTVAEQFSLNLKNSHPVYKELFKLFKDDLSDQSRFEFLSVEAEDPNSLVSVPFWAWSNKYAEVTAILHKHRSDDDIKFAFPLVADVIRLCTCVIGGARLEIAPNYLPIDVIPSFARAQRRIYMTATLADDGILVSHFNARPESASDPIKPKGVGDIGDRMILAPQEINPKITRQEIKSLANDIAKNKNVVVIVPSSKSADFWRDSAAQILDRTNIAQGVDQLKSKHIGLVVLINKYDGVDLPDDACRLLIIDGVPEVYGLIERTEMAALAGTEIEITRQVQRIEQGMGRGVRSSDDYCVVLLLGSKLSRRVHSPSAREKFNSSTLAQIDLGIAVTQQIRGQPVANLKPVLDLCLDQDANWKKTSRNALVNATENSSKPVDPVVIYGREAFDLARARDFPKAADKMSAAVDATKDNHTRGFYLQTVAEYTHAFDPARAQEILLSASQLNNHILKPIAGVKYAKLSRKGSDQAIAAVEYMKQFKTDNDFLLAVNGLIDDLAWDENRTKEFEAAIYELGRLLGLESQRPEQTYKSGPDNLWSIGDLRYIVIECKSGAKSPTISKSDCDQLGGSVKWFFDHYDKSCTAAPLMIHPHYTFDKQASPLDAIRIMDAEHLSRLQTKLREYAVAIAGSSSIRNKNEVEKHLKQFGFMGGDFISQYSRSFLKQT